MNAAYPARGDLEGRRAQMFPALSTAQIARVAAFGREQSFDAGALVWEQGDSDVPFYVIVEGELEVVHPCDGVERPVTVHEAGEFTGEMSLLFGRRSLVRARARGALRTIRVESARLQALVQTDPELSEIVMRAFILRRMGLLSEGWGDAVVIGSRDSAATLRLQAFLVRNGQPYRYVDVDRDPDVQAMLDRFHVGVDDVPILVCRGERVLRRPTEAEVAECLGLNPSIEPLRVFDVVVCGAGPGGLAAAVYGASEGLDVMVVEASAPGGQAASSSKIENYLGFPTGLSGQALSARGVAQAEKFGARMTVACGAAKLHCEETPIRIELSGGESIRARTVVVATGVEYRKLDLPGLARFEGVGVYYAATFVEAQRCGPEEVIVVGGANSAGQAATYLARSAARVHVLVRGMDLAEKMSRYLVRRIEETPNITVHRRTRVVGLRGGEHLEDVTWRDDASGVETTQPIRHLFSMAGAVPNTEWLRGCVALDDKGFVVTGTDLDREVLERERWPVARAPHVFETSQRRVFAVGDVRANSVKRVASAVGEGSVCIQLVHKVLAE
ncbi:MAG TPA: FAD-dependent oxidoreductase [Polyangiaceae bacterium]|nr:FAD-dependent oxidoreductase [Polyangiaceae bacterium]